MIKLLLSGVVAFACIDLTLVQNADAAATHLPRRQKQRPAADWGTEAHVRQETGRIKPSSAPIKVDAPVQNRAPSTAPATCNDQNASSQACYTATQQSRPVTR